MRLGRPIRRASPLAPALTLLALLVAGCTAPAADVGPPITHAHLPPPLPVDRAGDDAATDAAAPPTPPARDLRALPAAADPLQAGTYAVERADYEFDATIGENRGDYLPFVVRLRGETHHPVEGKGPFPLVLLMHGRHNTCTTPLREFAGPQVVGGCPRAPPVVSPIDSYTGYRYLAENLASHGYVVASVDANAVNENDGDADDWGAQGRAQIVVRTLDHLARLHREGGEGPGDALRGRLDLDRIGLMGHSRGGEGVTYAIHHNAARTEGEPHAIRAVFALAPIDRNSVTAPGVAFATLLPYCDGDVTSLAGARIYDDSRRLPGDESPKTQILVLGANHNSYNTVWTADDARGFEGDPHCGKEGAPGEGRLSAEDQRREGLAHMAAFFRLHLGDESAYAPLFDGRATLPPSACPGGASACPTLVHVSHAPPASKRRLIEDATDAETLEANDAGGASRLVGFTEAAVCAPGDCSKTHVAGSAPRLVLAWDAPARYILDLGEAVRDASPFTHLALRAALEPGSGVTDPRIVLTDLDGRNGTVRVGEASRAIFEPPGGKDAQHVVLNDVRIPLSAFAGVDLARLARVSLVLDAVEGGARLHVADVELQRLA